VPPGNLRFGKIASCVQFGSIQFHDGLSGPQGVAFPGKNLFDSTAATRTYMHFVHLNCSGDGIAPMPASRGEERQRKQRCAANTIVDLSSHERRYETGFRPSAQAIEPCLCPLSLASVMPVSLRS